MKTKITQFKNWFTAISKAKQFKGSILLLISAFMLGLLLFGLEVVHTKAHTVLFLNGTVVFPSWWSVFMLLVMLAPIIMASVLSLQKKIVFWNGVPVLIFIFVLCLPAISYIVTWWGALIALIIYYCLLFVSAFMISYFIHNWITNRFIDTIFLPFVACLISFALLTILSFIIDFPDSVRGDDLKKQPVFQVHSIKIIDNDTRLFKVGPENSTYIKEIVCDGYEALETETGDLVKFILKENTIKCRAFDNLSVEDYGCDKNKFSSKVKLLKK